MNDETIYLRPLTLDDVNDRYLSWVNNPSVTEFLEIGIHRLEYADLIKYVQDSPKNGRYNYAIITKISKSHIGNCSIHKIDIKNKTFEIGWFIGEKKYWGGHYSFTTILNLFKIGFIDMGLDKCTGFVDKRHIKARMTNKFVGFREIGKESRFIKKENKKEIFIKLEITKKEWIKVADDIQKQFPEFFKN